MNPPILQSFPALSDQIGLRHGFLTRVTGIDVAVDRQRALARLESCHQQALSAAGVEPLSVKTLCQVHGDRVRRVVNPDDSTPHWQADGFATNIPGICLGIYVADCAAVYLFDPVKRAIALLHSGKKGAEAGIIRQAVQLMKAAYDSNPSDLLVQVSPCIRPPQYDLDFAAQIERDARAAGIVHYHDCGDNTGADLQRFYSYRMEKGKTGRMLAFLVLTS